GGVMTVMIPRNTTIPTRKTEIYTTAADYQTSVEIHVLQGERPMARDNRTLGRFNLTDIPPAPRGIPQIEVTFDIDANGILNVQARDKATGKEQKITITGSTTLSKEDVDRMIKDAEAHAEEDRKRRELIEERNKAENLTYQVEKFIKDNQDKIPASDREAAEAAIKKVREVMAGEDTSAIRQAMDELTQTFHRIGEAMYRAQTTGAQAASTDGRGQQEAAKEGEEVIDAEYKTAD
ncbi:MAG: Hsp70 family protein, partial [Abditibacteriales bacterium]|nr:Hsp70 family protein [Abditibacteriales bacterium]MDW8367540.1 Hsp70 family protein [Abditibacteriales bacterium]